MKVSIISSVKIYNLNGTVVQVFNKPKTFNNHILKAGMYLAVIEWNDKKIERQLIQIRQNNSENEKSF